MLKRLMLGTMLMLSLNSHAACLDPSDDLIPKLQKNITLKIFRLWISQGKADYTGLDKEALWFEAVDLATEIVEERFVCPDPVKQEDI